MRYRHRIGALQHLLGRHQVFLVTKPSDIAYYTGYPLLGDDQAFLVVTKRHATFIVSPLNNDAVRLRHVEVQFLGKNRLSSLLKNKRVGYDEYAISAHQFTTLKKITRQLTPSAALIKQPRMIKDAEEIALMKKGIAINRKILGRLELEGKSEQEIAQEIEIGFLRHGAERSFATIVASGKNAAFIHYRPAQRTVGRKDLVVIDCGARAQYCTDMTRTRCLRPGTREQRLMDDVAAIQQEVIGAIEVGMKFGELQDVYERLTKKKHYRVMHSIGHGVGLDVHERPGQGDRLEKGMVITIEPGVYLGGFGGCRIEDMVLVGNKTKVLS